ncbi:MAG: class I SAM-dependent methyltransferase [Gemmobacter sp.]
MRADIAALTEAPEIAALDLSMFGPADVANVILQRSEVLFDVRQAGDVIRSWEAGDPGPLQGQARRLGAEAVRRAAAVILAEYRALEPVLRPLAPRRIADIGCGYAFWDLFAARSFGSDLLLIDLETNERRHFGYSREAGAAYSSLAVARQMLVANGIAPSTIRTLNPAVEPAETAGPVDLAVSFLSCGFHFPAATYAAFLQDAVAPSGAVILDLRAATAEEQLAALPFAARVEDLPSPPKARRVLLQKAR